MMRLEMRPPRQRFAGTMQIVRFNWPRYAAAMAVSTAAGALVLGADLSWWIDLPLALGAAVCVFWMVSSLVASCWIYDLSGLCDWRWIRDTLPRAPRRWAALHAGLDEAGAALEAMFPHGAGQSLDFYDPREMTEPSIGRARAETKPRPGTRHVRVQALPLDDGEHDAVFLILAAHEVRDPRSRLALFREIRRALSPGGRLLLVEHLRDLANLVAFGPGFLHFFPRREWLRLGREAGLALQAERSFTPFVRSFTFVRAT